MKKLGLFIFDHLISTIILLLVIFLSVYFFVKYPYNTSKVYYKANIETSMEVSEIDKDFFMSKLKKEDGTYSYSTFSSEDFFNSKDVKITKEGNVVTIYSPATFFISSSSSLSSDETSYKRFYNVLNLIFVKKSQGNTILATEEIIGKQADPLLSSLVGLAIGVVIIGVSYFFISRKYERTNIYDKKEVFKSPFSLSYWKCAINSITKLRIFDMCFIAILFALQLILKLVSIPSGFANLSLGVNFLVFASLAMMYGPFWGLIIGLASDVLGFFIFGSTGAFNVLYSVQAMLTGFTYGIFLYRTKFSFAKCFYSRLIVNIILNAIMGTALWGMPSVANFTEFSQYKTFFLYYELPKNIIYLIPQTILLFVYLKTIIPLLKGRKIIPESIINDIK